MITTMVHDEDQLISLTIFNQIRVSDDEPPSTEGVTIRCYRGDILRDCIRQYMAEHEEAGGLDVFDTSAFTRDGERLSMTSAVDELAGYGDTLTIYLNRRPFCLTYPAFRKVEKTLDNIRRMSIEYFCTFYCPTFSIVTIFIGFLILALYFFLYTRSGKQAVILDAGSSHTSVSKFSIYPGTLNSSEIIEEEFGCEMSVKGIDSFTQHPVDVVSYLLDNNCFRKALTYVNPIDRKRAVLVLGATGGMRTLKMTKPEATSEILGNVTWVFNYLGFSNATDQVKILNGTEESLYAWVSVNYLSKSLESGHLVGSLDWGGASSQLTFPYGGQDFPDHVKSVEVLNNTINVFSISHECYGQQKALNRYFMGLIYKEFNGTGSLNSYIHSPCHPRQIKPTVLSGFDLYGECTEYQDEAFDSLIKDNLNSNFTFFGTGNVSECKLNIAEQFDLDRCSKTYKNSKFCLDRKAMPKPPEDMSFYALSTYWYLVELFNLPSTQADSLDGLKMSEDEFGKISRIACKSFDVESLFLGWNSNRVHNACFRSLFMQKLLFDGYGFRSFKNLTFANKINGSSVSWSLGYLFSISSKIANSHVWAISLELIAVYVGCLSFGLIIAILIRYFGCHGLNFHRFF